MVKATPQSSLASATSQPKFEKKLMDEKISKVREVVKNVSTNDIVLALHNFDLDVERTIHAFCEGGSQIALGDWEKTGAVKKRNNKKKSKSAKGNGISNGQLTNEMTKDAPRVESSHSSTPFAADSAGSTTPNLQTLQQNLLNDNSDTVLDPKNILTLTAPEDENRALFENEVTYARENIQRCLKEARDAISLREQELLSELSSCHKDGIEYFAARTETVKQIAKIKNPKLAAELEKRNSAAKIVDLETALATRFFYDSNAFTSLIESLNQFGSVIPVKATESIFDNGNKKLPEEQQKENNENKNAVIPSVRQAVRRSNSPSSLVSSMDSGLGGQISPVIQEKGPIAQVGENGFVLKSDSIAPDQLAEIQRNIFESLKAKGIDPALLADINSNAIVAPRRRQPPATGKKH